MGFGIYPKNHSLAIPKGLLTGHLQEYVTRNIDADVANISLSGRSKH